MVRIINSYIIKNTLPIRTPGLLEGTTKDLIVDSVAILHECVNGTFFITGFLQMLDFGAIAAGKALPILHGTQEFPPEQGKQLLEQLAAAKIKQNGEQPQNETE